MPFVNFMIANSAGAVPGHCSMGLAHIISAKVSRNLRDHSRWRLVGAIVVVSMILYWRRKEQELAAAAERDISGPLQVEPSEEADG